LKITIRSLLLAIVLLAVITSLGFLAWRFFLGGEERAIQKVFDRAIELVQKNGPEGELTAIGRASELTRLFVIPFRIQPLPDITSQEISNPDDLRAAVFRARSAVDSIDVDILDLRIEVGQEGDTATMWMAVRGSFDGNPDLREEIYRFRVQWNKVNGDWKIAGVQPADTIRMPGR
jgi:hypothetical protein